MIARSLSPTGRSLILSESLLISLLITLINVSSLETCVTIPTQQPGNHRCAPMHAYAQVGLQDSAGSQVRTFSGGMRRRLSVAIALLGNPRVIYLDEPTTGECWHQSKN